MKEEGKIFFHFTTKDLYEKMKHDFNEFEKDCKSHYCAMNFVLSSYHLGEWVWKSYLKENIGSRSKLSPSITSEKDFYDFLNNHCQELKCINNIANQFKHLSKGKNDKVKEISGPKKWCEYNIPWSNIHHTWEYDGIVIITSDNHMYSLLDIFTKVSDLWNDVFDKLEGKNE